MSNQIKLSNKKYIVSKTDKYGVIKYGNDYFFEISGYLESELLGKNHNIIRHPDMPRIIFKLMWNRIELGRNIFAAVKNLAKNGDYYWVITEFEPTINKKTGEIVGHTAYRKALDPKVQEIIEPIYSKLLDLEKKGGMEASEKYLFDFLRKEGKSYDKFMDDLIGNKGIFKLFFNTMKKMSSK